MAPSPSPSPSRSPSGHSVDAAFKALGASGGWQILQYIVLSLAYIPQSFNTLIVNFVGYEPNFWCASLNHTGNHSVEDVNKCQVSSNNTLSSCDAGFVFDIHRNDASIVSEWSLVCDRQILAEISQIVLYGGLAAGGYIATLLSDRFGRRNVYLICQSLLLVFALATAIAHDIVTFTILRFFIGVFSIGSGLTAIILSIEVFPVSLRTYAALGSGFVWAFFVTIYSGIAYALSPFSWRVLQFVNAATSLVVIPQFFILEESIRWLLANGRTKEAVGILKRAAKWNKVPLEPILSCLGQTDVSRSSDDPDNLTSSQENVVWIKQSPSVTESDMGTRETILLIFRHRKLLCVTLIMTWTWVVNVLTYSGPVLLSSTLTENRYLAFFLNAIVEIPALGLASVILLRLGRKRACILLHLLCSASFLCAMGFQAAQFDGADIAITVVSVIGKFWATGSFVVILVFTPEVFPTNIRATGLGIAAATCRFAGMITPYFAVLACRIRWAPDLIFSICCILVAVFTMFAPETGDKELPQDVNEIDRWFEKSNLSSERKRGKQRCSS